MQFTFTDDDFNDVPFNRTELEACLKVLSEIHTLENDDERFIAVRRGTSSMFKDVKKHRRREAREAILAADRETMERTATGAADRLDDETHGRDLHSSVPDDVAEKGATVGHYIQPRGCYICKKDYVEVDAFHHALCPECAASNRSRRKDHADLRGKKAVLTGGRAKIGMHIALRLLRDGAHLTITTRFPKDAARRFASLEDSKEWLHRLRIVGIDLRDPGAVTTFAQRIAAEGPLDIVINNAAQTVRRTAGSYSQLLAGEETPLSPALDPANGGPEIWGAEAPPQEHPRSLAAAFHLGAPALPQASGGSLAASSYSLENPEDRASADRAQRVAELAMTAGAASMDRIAAGTAIDAGGLIPDIVTQNSWTQVLGEVDALEMLEVQLCNVTAPFLLNSILRPALAASPARRKYIVNVSAMEGQFSRRYKGAGHPHTNMAKAALNMMTRTAAEEFFETDRILMTAVDTGWITDERPHDAKLRKADEGWHAPLDLIDGAARVYHPIVDGERGIDLYGCFIKDYVPSPW
ncbi:SDR family NAD(P)-dependent oxidoreductase [Neomicrococcus aestuarii]|uniref:NAD(P)-dependent dehydrogenase (Short-subunit alcohol dehydrogenase family) n=1 Tax=Neomicrococcus aestuarii TaxID=556325 RepID=A0A1L2ZL57_9MICC|nr:SDR family NAD(P)-dependent oxidoreductase [Neomicrococcus aestuarii]APF40155.1 short-chain dehydrogenase [Neomicrococcus aestuarii]MBB5511863.1 NAD(P)-dependent dehydrogenase (short-subunit alcohol dehydrogenase family) [Neomicrococcus aestuarii]